MRQRQELQQRKSIHELSKIDNVNEIPLPFRVPLPDIPLTNPTTSLIKMIRGASKKNGTSRGGDDGDKEAVNELGATPSASPLSNTDTTDAEMLRC